MKPHLLFLLLLLSATFSLNGQSLRPAAVFSDEMVLQRETQVPVWGFASPGEKVTVRPSWNNRTYNAVTGPDGRWRAIIHTPVAGGPHTLSLSSRSGRITLHNVYIGEVWVASGQSNMSMPLKGYGNQPVMGATQEILRSGKTHIHFINLPPLAAFKPLQDANASWVKAIPENAGDCTAVGWFFARALDEQLDIPIGIINASYGGSNIEAWMPAEACREFDDIQVPEESDETSEWLANVPSTLFNGMLNPVIGYGIRGFIWYQGESNIFNVPRYAPSVEAMVRHWRRLWSGGDLPFYFVQIAPYDYTEWNFFTPQWPEISAYQRDAQRRCLDLIPNSGMAVTLDIGDKDCIHPRNKREVGTRLAYLALARDYGIKGFESESPEFDYMEITEDRAILHFKKMFAGLSTFGRKLTLFEIAGDNDVFVPAEAYIDEENWTVVVYDKRVKKPVKVRYAFRNYLEGELFGTGGLPVGSFCTGEW